MPFSLLSPAGAMLPSYEQMLAELVSIPSVSSTLPSLDQSNEAVIDKLQEWIALLGFRHQKIEVAPGKFNLIGILGGNDAHLAHDAGLVLSGHTDTVPYDGNRWMTDPFTLSSKEDRWYGLGTCDMKGFFPAVLLAVQSLVSQKQKYPITLLATADEESAMTGARSLATSRPSEIMGRKAAIIGEPTSLRPVRMHKGIMMEAIRVKGQSGHSSNPQLGNNALECMSEVLTSLMVFRHEMQDRHRNPMFHIDVPTLNLGHIHGGDSPNRICGHCELHFDLRPLPGMPIDDLHDQLERWIAPLAQKYGTQISLVRLFGGVEAFENSPDAELVALSEKLTGCQAQAVAFATEAPYLSELGLDTLVMGPGSIDQAHQPNEFIEKAQAVSAVELLTKIIRHYCY